MGGWEEWGMAKPPRVLGKAHTGERRMGQDYVLGSTGYAPGTLTLTRV